jgi:hypothetical protein
LRRNSPPHIRVGVSIDLMYIPSLPNVLIRPHLVSCISGTDVLAKASHQQHGNIHVRKVLIALRVDTHTNETAMPAKWFFVGNTAILPY